MLSKTTLSSINTIQAILLKHGVLYSEEVVEETDPIFLIKYLTWKFFIVFKRKSREYIVDSIPDGDCGQC